MNTQTIINLCHKGSMSTDRKTSLQLLKFALKGLSPKDYQFLKVGLKSSVVSMMIAYAEAL
jgi:hypothetical protein